MAHHGEARIVDEVLALSPTRMTEELEARKKGEVIEEERSNGVFHLEDERGSRVRQR